MNLPNKITLFRVILTPVFIFFMLMPTIPYNNIIALAIFIIASLSDMLDGKIARKYNLVTDFGKFMDPLADKLLVCSSLILFVGLDRVNSVIVIVIIAREFIISGFRLVAADKGIVIAAGIWGKIKTAVSMVMCCVVILHLDFPVYAIIENVLIWASLALTVISLLDYLIRNKDVISDR